MRPPEGGEPTSVRRLDRPGDDVLAQTLVESDPAYAERVTGLPPGDGDGVALLSDVPPGFDPADKHVLGLFAGDELVAAADLLRGYPEPGFVFVGLLQVHGAHHGQGLGRRMHAALVEYATTWPEAVRLRLAVVDTNAAGADPFWRAMGYTPTGEERPWHEGRVETTVRLWERPLR